MQTDPSEGQEGNDLLNLLDPETRLMLGDMKDDNFDYDTKRKLKRDQTRERYE